VLHGGRKPLSHRANHGIDRDHDKGDQLLPRCGIASGVVSAAGSRRRIQVEKLCSKVRFIQIFGLIYAYLGIVFLLGHHAFDIALCQHESGACGALQGLITCG